ncbi:ankyrin repeat domain-containing protein [Pseudalkalibacillus hwajinpoensis]|nr:ankyrin repeat domain-containing protein [Pseudalkalibacillus hwajinpoensis]
MNNKMLFVIPFLVAVGCSDIDSNEPISESIIKASAAEESADVETELSSHNEKLWEIIYKENIEPTDYKEMNRLFTLGLDVDTKNEEGMTPIAYAVMIENHQMVKWLLQAGADVHLSGENERLLEIATNNKSYDIIDLLLKMGAQFEVGNENMLIKAIQEENLDLINTLLQNGYNPNLEAELDGAKSTLLNYAIMEENEDLTTMLLNAGANPNFAVDSGEDSAVVVAVKEGKSSELVSLLLARGGDANARFNGKAILFEAIKQNHEELVEALLVAGALPFSLEESEQAFELAKKDDNIAISEVLMQYGW